ncbi:MULTISPECIES: hypothetical protein [unclassified Lentimonas]|uniref:hypothetical protein n=1 Tax=unclassified Lentimonas TaxID=2630993 RepID=UPI00132313B7|nr:MULTISPECIES: hypothetical protein [unclassified Lentimonas]CAA6679362.1 Unannotated [Lentimonas sp. CC4]CAA6687359.1 Unannotated [Lentimonas sp. CC6]CAA7078031.1 Unannotated [Lentimonas sp. CC4]CAA7168001.1 Unannotated [Lentimonas sp. CC21]CAA7179576.1 Unannotated [Lentimonas sp. CC8]
MNNYAPILVQSRGRERNSGFALVIALSLMAFVLLLLLSISVFVQVETKVATQGLTRLEAENNALLGVYQALGNLQKLAGPDQRITANANLFTETASGGAAAPVDVQQSQWLGVWNVEGYEELGDESTYDALTLSERFAGSMGWLVSGDPATVSPEDADVTYETLVSEKTVESESGVAEAITVKAPLVEVLGAGGQVESRYAYWVGDNSQKATVNLGGDLSSELDAAQQLLLQQSLATSQGGNLAFGDAYDMDRSERVLSLADAAIIGAQAPQDFFHDATTRSDRLLTNTQRGGLRKDLSVAFDVASALDDKTDTQLPDRMRVNRLELPSEFQIDEGDLADTAGFLYVLENQSVVNPWTGGTVTQNQLRGPAWQIFADFYNLQDNYDVRGEDKIPTLRLILESYQKTGADAFHYLERGYRTFQEYQNQDLQYYKSQLLSSSLSNNKQIPKEETPVSSQMYPILTEFALFFTLGFSADGELELRTHPYVEFTNPYDTTLDFDGDLEILFYGINALFNFELIGADSVLYSDEVSATNRTSSSMMYSNVATTSIDKIQFKMKAVQPMAPGEVRYLVLDTSKTNRPDSMFLIDSNDDWKSNYVAAQVRPKNLGSGSVYNLDRVWLGGSAAQDPVYQLADYDVLQTEVIVGPTELDSGGNAILNRPRFFFVKKESGSNRMQPIQAGSFYVAGAANQLVYSLKSTSIPGEDISAEVELAAFHLRLPSADDLIFTNDPEDFLGNCNPRAPLLNQANGNVGSTPAAFAMATMQYDVWENADEILNLGSWGSSNVDSTEAPLFHVPRQAPVSLGDFRHLNLSIQPHEPAYVVGNSLKPYGMSDNTRYFENVASTQTSVSWSTPNSLDGVDYGSSGVSSEESDMLVDVAYLTNRALWDGYFLSTYDEDDAFFANPRMRFLPNRSVATGEVLAYDTMAKKLYVEGAFNVNSTSVKAWEMFLGGMQEIEIDGAPVDHVYLNKPEPEGAEDDEWKGFQTLDEADILELAQKVVEQVKARGPFISLSHFINRQLEAGAHGERGALQAAIDETDINNGLFPFSPAWLKQTDMLGPLGPFLSVRGDTFTIRAKGESLNSVTGEVDAEVWCEAIVQRLPEYIDSDETSGNDSIDLPADLITLNQRFGRRFEIVSFRWLSRDEI